MKEDYNFRIVNLAAILLVAVLAVLIMISARMILLPLAWALFVALLILPLIKWMERKKVPRSLAIISALVIFTAAISAVLYLLSAQIVGLLRDAPAVTAKLDTWIGHLQLSAEEYLGVSNEMISRQISDSLSGMVHASLISMRNSLLSVFQTLTLISVIPLYIFFMLYYRETFYEGMMGVARNYRSTASNLVGKVVSVIQRYLAGLMAVTLLMAILFYLTLTLLGINYALFFAIFLAIFNLIPYVGVILASLAVLLYTVATTDTIFYPVAVLFSLWFIQVVENNLVTPYILGHRVKVNPMVALIAIFAGAGIWGVSGMILFIPLVGVLKVVCDEIESLKPYGILLGS